MELHGDFDCGESGEGEEDEDEGPERGEEMHDCGFGLIRLCQKIDDKRKWGLCVLIGRKGGCIAHDRWVIFMFDIVSKHTRKDVILAASARHSSETC